MTESEAIAYARATGLLKAQCLIAVIDLETLIKFADVSDDRIVGQLRDTAEKLRTALREAEQFTTFDTTDQEPA